MFLKSKRVKKTVLRLSIMLRSSGSVVLHFNLPLIFSLSGIRRSLIRRILNQGIETRELASIIALWLLDLLLLKVTCRLILISYLISSFWFPLLGEGHDYFMKKNVWKNKRKSSWVLLHDYANLFWLLKAKSTKSVAVLQICCFGFLILLSHHLKEYGNWLIKLLHITIRNWMLGETSKRGWTYACIW